ncbi:MAG: choice-of-anchor Q domain-containing protein, partial [Rhodanobacteraceae bacterium]
MKSGFLRSGLALVLFALTGPVVFATTRTWPGAAPCNTTMQACIDGAANGDLIYVQSNATIDEHLNLYDRSVTIRAANGYHPALADGRSIWITTSTLVGNITARVSGIRLLNGFISVLYNGTGTGTYELRDMDANKITLEADGGTVEASFYNNRLDGTPSGINDGVLQINNRGAELNAEVYFNHIRRKTNINSDGAGIFVDERSGSSGKMKLLGNVVHGAFNRGGIFVSEGLFSATPSSFTAYAYGNVVVCDPSASIPGSGVHFTVKDGSMTAQAVNNTVSGCNVGVTASQWSGSGSGASIGGLVSNNLVAGANYGLSLNQPLASSMTNDYNLINATHNTNGGFALGSHTITAPAKLVSSGIPRLTAASPAVDAADNALLGLGLAFNNLPGLDADGLRRFKGPGSPHADIGAYEYGDMSFMHTASAPSNSHISSIYNPITDG